MSENPSSLARNTKVSALYILGTLGFTAILLTLLVWQASASTSDYNFLIRGDIKQVDSVQRSMKVYVRLVAAGNENDLAGQTVEIKTDDSIFYKYNSSLKKIRTTLGSFDVGNEVVIKGAKRTSGNYNASWIVRNDNSVNIRGTVDTQSLQSNYLDINVDKVVRKANGKAFRASQYPVSTIIRVYYDDDSTKFLSRDGNAMNEDELSNNSEKITITNVDYRNGGRFVAGPDSTIHDGKYTF